jgi:limonene-1,2-epoxide hydrolase
MKPIEIVEEWINRFNASDADGLAQLYSSDAVNDQVVFSKPQKGRDAIKRMFEIEFGRAKMVCNKEYIHKSDDWIILEWSDPLGLRGCGFFKIKNNQIIFQRGYFDQLTFFKIQGLPLLDDYLDT